MPKFEITLRNTRDRSHEITEVIEGATRERAIEAALARHSAGSWKVAGATAAADSSRDLTLIPVIRDSQLAFKRVSDGVRIWRRDLTEYAGVSMSSDDFAAFKEACDSFGIELVQLGDD